MMKEELFKKLLVYMNNLEGFVSQEIPDLFLDIIKWGRGMFFVDIVICLACSLILFFAIRQLFKKDKYGEYVWEDDPPRTLCSLIVGILCLITLLCTFGEGIDNLKAFIAPKLYLIDYLTGNLGKT